MEDQLKKEIEQLKMRLKQLEDTTYCKDIECTVVKCMQYHTKCSDAMGCFKPKCSGTHNIV